MAQQGTKQDGRETNQEQLEEIHNNKTENQENTPNTNQNYEGNNEQDIPPEQLEMEQKWLEEILNHPIRVYHPKTETEAEKFTMETVRDIIDPVKDIWFMREKNKPGIKDPGTRKLIKATGATFPKVIPIEKQSDFTSKDREQVVIEASVVFPDETENVDYGVANRQNCKDPISQSNMPIMARKRAMHRAFLRSDYIGLNDLYDQSEVLDVEDKRLEQKVKLLEEKISQMDLKHKNLINQLCKEIKTSDDEFVWKITDVQKLVHLAKGNKDSLVSYLANLRLRFLKNKAND